MFRGMRYRQPADRKDKNHAKSGLCSFWRGFSMGVISQKLRILCSLVNLPMKLL